MNALTTAIGKFCALTRSWKPEDERSFQDYARLLVVTAEVKRLTAEQAIQRRPAHDRELLARMHGLAAGMEATARSRLSSFADYHPVG